MKHVLIITCETDDAQLERFNAKRRARGMQERTALDVIECKISDGVANCEEIVPGSVRVRSQTILEDIIARMAADPTLKYSLECGIEQIDPDERGNEQFRPTAGRTLTLHTHGGAVKNYIPCPRTVVEPTHGTEYSITHRPCQLHAGHKGLCC